MQDRTLGNSDIDGAKKNVTDLVLFGNENCWQLISKASSQEQGFMKTTKAMKVQGGVVVQLETQQKNADGSWALSQSCCFCPAHTILTYVDKEDNTKVVGREIVFDPNLIGTRPPQEESKIIKPDTSLLT